MDLELYLVGTLHVDFKGPERLRKLLDHIRPEILAVEGDENESKKKFVVPLLEQRVATITPDFLNVLRDLFGKVNHETAEHIFSIQGYEIAIAQQYCLQQNVPLHFCDNPNPEIVKDKDSYYLQMYKLYFQKSLSALRQDIEERYSREKIEMIHFTAKDLQDITRRDQYAEGKIRSLSGKVVYMGGLGHIFGSYFNLYNRLENLHPKRIRLNEADLL